jgi:hypothetical protein
LASHVYEANNAITPVFGRIFYIRRQKSGRNFQISAFNFISHYIQIYLGHLNVSAATFAVVNPTVLFT